MFKIHSIRIKGIQPFEEAKFFEFGPYFSLIRGDNGAGKTTVLESIALLGHCGIMIRDNSFDTDRLPTCCIEYKVILGDCYFGDAVGSEIQRLATIWDDLRARLNNHSNDEKTPVEITVHIYHLGSQPLDDLKADLKDEDILNKMWRIAGDEDQVTFLQDLTRFSRPRQKPPLPAAAVESSGRNGLHNHAEAFSGDSSGERLDQIMEPDKNEKPTYECPERSRYLGKEVFLPPFICYFNTDMYHYGIGLDIRESPKHLSEELPGLIRDRFHLVRQDKRLINFDLVSELWENIFQEESQGVLKDISVEFDRDKAHITIQAAGSQTRHFMSSGENQALSIGIPLTLLEPKHSILLLDEPELHLSLPTSVNMYNEVIKRSLIDDIQIISVSHLPFVFPQALHAKNAIETVVDFSDLHSTVRIGVKNLIEQEKLRIEKEELGDRSKILEEKESRVIGKSISRRLRGIKNALRNWFRKSKSKRELQFPKCITLYYLEKQITKDGSRIEPYMQEDAANKAGDFQNRELDSIRRQSHAVIKWRDFLKEVWALTRPKVLGSRKTP